MTDPENIARQNKQLIREILAGYAAAAVVIEQERIERLRLITDEEARADYAALVNFHRLFGNKADRQGLERLEEWHIQEKIALRRAFEKVAHARGLF